MGFVRSFDELARTVKGKEGSRYEFYEAEALTVIWETRPEIVERLLPPPLKPGSRPLATAFAAYYPKVNFGPAYHEAALFLRAEFGGVEGNYCLAMPVDGDQAMAGGREEFGYPKKMAAINFGRSGDRVEGSVERHGLRFFEVRAALRGRANADEFQEIVTAQVADGGTIIYNFKHFFAPDGSGFDYNPRLVRERVILRPSVAEIGEAEVVLSPSDYDPWAEVEIVRMLGAVYTVGHNTMLPGEVVAEADPLAFLPYALLKWDYWPVD